MTPRWPFLFLLAGATALGIRTAPTAGQDAPPGEEPPGAAVVDSGRDVPAPAITWYCAAGTLGEPAAHEIVVSNPGSGTVQGRVTLHSETGQADHGRARPISVEPGGAVQLSLADLVGARPSEGAERRDRPRTTPARRSPSSRERSGRSAGEGPDDGSGDGPRYVAALVETEAPVIVDHEVRGPHGAAEGPCATSGASTWHFAWGATTRDARDVLVLFNPFPNDVVVDASFTVPEGRREPVRWQGLTVPARQVVAVDVGEDVTRRPHVAATVEARQGSLVVEHLQMFDGSIGTEGLWLRLGRTAPDATAVFPGGDLSREGRELVALYNPTGSTAEVDVAVRPDDPDVLPPQPFHLTVRPGRARVVDYTEEQRITTGRSYATLVHSTNGVPVVARHVLMDGD